MADEHILVPVVITEPIGNNSASIRVPVTVVEPLGDGDPSVRVPVVVVEPIGDGNPVVRVPSVVVEPLGDGDPRVRVASCFIEVLIQISEEPELATLVFPSLIGLSWNIQKKPIFNTRVAPTQGGKESRNANFIYPQWEFNLSYDYLPEGVDVYNPGDLQYLINFFLECQGKFSFFLFRDVTDYQVRSNSVQYVADGVSVQWPLVRRLVPSSTFAEPVGQVDLSAVVSFSSSAVNVGSSTITIPDHGMLSNYSGPYFLSSTIALPTGLFSATAYWPIVIDANTIQLSSQCRNGPPVTLTAAGSGINSITKGWAFITQVFETDVIPAMPGPYTITVTNAASFVQDEGVTIGATVLTKVSGAPANNQYSVTSAGVYTFNSNQAGASAVITYNYYIPQSVVSVTGNVATYTTAIANGQPVWGEFDFYYVCRFKDDTHDYENFLYKLWDLQECDFIAIPQ